MYSNTSLCVVFFFFITTLITSFGRILRVSVNNWTIKCGRWKKKKILDLLIYYFQKAMPASCIRWQPTLYHNENGSPPQPINHAERESMLAGTQHEDSYVTTSQLRAQTEHLYTCSSLFGKKEIVWHDVIYMNYAI